MRELPGLRWRSSALVIVLFAAGCTTNASSAAQRRTEDAPVTQPAVAQTGPGPGQATTGVPAGTVLNRRGTLIVRTDRAVIDAQEVTGAILVRANDVTITRTKVNVQQAWGIRLMDGFKGLVIRDVEVAGGPSCEGAVVFGDYTATRVNVHGCEDGFRVGDDTTIEDSWVHDLLADATSHNDGIQTTNGRHIVIRRNAIDHIKAQTSAILLKADFAPIDDVLVEDNRLNGGSYVVYVRDTAKFKATNVTVRRNRIGRDYLFGVLSHDADAQLVWDANVWVDTGAAVPLPPPDR